MELIKPMLAKPSSVPQNDNDYAYEVKWDGIRTISYTTGNQFILSSRNLRNITSQYPELSKLKEYLPPDTILDGEIVALDESGRPSFELLQSRMGLTSPKLIQDMKKRIPITYILFDILFLEKESLLSYSFLERRRKLTDLKLSGPFWQISSYSIGNGLNFLTASRELGLEGIVAKRVNSLYHPGKRTGDWLKIKNQLRQELVIGGWLGGKGSRLGRLGALLVGYYDISPDEAKRSGRAQKLMYAGKVGTGFSFAELDRLKELLTSLENDVNPFMGKTPSKGATFVEPRLVAEFEFTEWTINHTMRHPSYKGLRNDKEPFSVIRET